MPAGRQLWLILEVFPIAVVVDHPVTPSATDPSCSSSALGLTASEIVTTIARLPVADLITLDFTGDLDADALRAGSVRELRRGRRAGGPVTGPPWPVVMRRGTW